MSSARPLILSTTPSTTTTAMSTGPSRGTSDDQETPIPAAVVADAVRRPMAWAARIGGAGRHHEGEVRRRWQPAEELSTAAATPPALGADTMTVTLSVVELEQIGIGHPAVKDVLAILRNSSANRFNLVVAEGLWAVRLVLDLNLRMDKFFVCPEMLRSDDARKRCQEATQRARRSFQVSEKTIDRISERGEADGLLVLAEMPTWYPEQLELGGSALILVSDGIEIPGNLGTLIRTLDACAADALIMTNRRTRMSHPKVFRGSQGMNLSVPYIEFDDVAEAIDWLKRRNVTVYLADTSESESYRNLDYSGRTAIVVGSERYGISKPWYGHDFKRVGVPMLGRADSLNVSVSASVLLYEARARKKEW